MPNPSPKQTVDIQRALAEINAAYSLFRTKVAGLRRAHRAKIQAILKRIDERKIRQILDRIQ